MLSLEKKKKQFKYTDNLKDTGHFYFSQESREWNFDLVLLKINQYKNVLFVMIRADKVPTMDKDLCDKVCRDDGCIQGITGPV